MAEKRYFDPSKIGGPFPLIAALILLTLIVVPSFVTAVGVAGEPWVAGLFALAAVAYPMLIIVVIWGLLTKYRENLMDDSSILQSKELENKARMLAARVDQELSESGATFETLLSGQFAQQPIAAHSTPDAAELIEVVDKLEEHGGLGAVPREALVESAKSLLAQHRWAEAARQLDAVAREDPDDWNIQFSRGVAHANSRSGQHGDMQALRAYNDAIALAPRDIDRDQRARLYIYRAAVKKRLGQLDDALADLELARPLASERYEVDDLVYNEACVLAMAGRYPEALEAVGKLIDRGGIDLVVAHADDYFRDLKRFEEFKRLLNARGTTA